MPQSPNFLEPLAPISEPLLVTVVSGEVVLIGPGRIAFSMTREAAAETCRRLSLLLAEDGGS